MIPIFWSPDFSSICGPFGLEGPKREAILKLNCNTQGCRCDKITLSPHIHGTHIENEYHVSDDNPGFPLTLSKPWRTLILDFKTETFMTVQKDVEFLILKKHVAFDGFNPEIVRTNEPSFDPEKDEGRLRFHRKFFKTFKNGFLVELLNLESTEIEFNQIYVSLLNPYFLPDTDAIPCSPVLIQQDPWLSQILSPASMLSDSCLFCKIIRGVIPSFKVYETAYTYAFLDINPLSDGHILVIPKFHGARLHEIDDAHLADLLPVAKKILVEGFGEKGAKLIPNYNILQSNGRLAHQEVDHVHFHIIPKPNEEEGLGIKWPTQKGNMEQLSKFAESFRAKLGIN